MKKKILFIVDVKGWAWWNKAHTIKNCLKDEFDIDVWLPGKSKIPQDFDLYFTFCPPMLCYLRGIKRDRKVTGITGHIRFKEWFVKDRTFYEGEVAALHANSGSLLDLMKLYHSKVYYVPNGVDTDLFKCQDLEEKDGLVVGFVGSHYSAAYKGLYDFINPAIAKVDGVELRTNLRSYSNRISQSKLVSFYKSIDVYIVASVAEGTPNPMCEAAACGRPVISNRIGNASEFIIEGQSGCLVRRDVAEYVGALHYFKAYPNEIKRMGLNARKQAERWSWKNQAENYRKMFRELI